MRLLKPNLYVRIAFLMLTGCTVINIGATVLGGYIDGLPLFNPFSAIVDELLSQPKSIIEGRGFLCTVSIYNPSSATMEELCSLNVTGDTVAQVNLFVVNGIIRQITFSLRDNTVRVSDLFVLWGTAEHQAKSHMKHLVWPSRSVWASLVPYTGRFSVLLPVRWVYFTDTISSR